MVRLDGVNTMVAGGCESPWRKGEVVHDCVEALLALSALAVEASHLHQDFAARTSELDS